MRDAFSSIRLYQKEVLLSFLLTILIIYPIKSQDKDYSISHISIDKGLSQSNVNCIFQDSKGYIWIGTDDGLNKFDGTTFTTYHNIIGDSASLPDNMVYTIYEDLKGNLWIGTKKSGICKYNPLLDNFIRTSIVRKNAHFVRSIIQNHPDILYIGTSIGLIAYNQEQNSTQSFNYQYNASILSMCFGPDKNIWLATERQGVLIFDVTTHQFKIPTLPKELLSLLEKEITYDILFDQNKTLFISNRTGLYILPHGSEKFYKAEDYIIPFQAGNNVSDLFLDSGNNLWVAKKGKGSIKINFDTRKVNYYTNNIYNENSLSKNISTIFEDKEGNIWMGTIGDGINLLSYSSKTFKNISRNKFDEHSLNNDIVNSILEDSDGNLWIGTFGGGVNYIDKKTNKIKYFTHDEKKPNTLSNDIIRCLVENSNGEIVITTNYGLNFLNLETHKITRFNHSKDFLQDRYSYIIEIEKDKYWIASNGGGLIFYDRNLNEIKVYNTSNSEISNNFLSHLVKYENKLWIAHSGGLSLFNPKDETFVNISHNEDNITGIGDFPLLCLHVDKKNNLWIGTMGGGLKLYQFPDTSFTVFNIKDGLPNDVINSIKEDSRGNLWISTNKGISKFVPPYYYKEEEVPIEFALKKGYKGTFKNYSVGNGMQINEFKPRSSANGKDGTLFFGGINGLNYFHPDSIKQTPVFPKVVLTNLYLSNKKITIEQNKESSYNLSKHINEIDTIVFKHNQSAITLEYNSLFFNPQQRVEYSYKLHGFDKAWNQVGIQRKATYTNLNEGMYCFEVLASTNNNFWPQNGKKIYIKILPPIWRTNLALIIYFIGFGAIFLFLRWFILYKERLKTELKLKTAQAEKEAELNNMKLRFFTNISHELKTPLTLITSPLEKLLQQNNNENKNVKQQYSLMYRNAKRLIRLINQIMDIRKIESGDLKLKLEVGNIFRFIEEIEDTFMLEAKRKDIALHFNIPETLNVYNFDPDKLEKILYNLLSNALKNTNAGGEIELKTWIAAKADVEKIFSFSIHHEQIEFLIVSIKDNGIGISQEDIPHIFERFYQTGINKEKNNGGTGIGLALVKELLELMDGDIKVESELNKGSRFTFFIPLTKALDEDLQNIKDEKPIHYDFNMLDSTGKVEESNNEKDIILIVEDDIDISYFLQQELSNNYNLIFAENGVEGFEQSLKYNPSLVLTDLMMPVSDGLELCNKLKNEESTSHIPIIVISAKSSTESKLEVLQTGVDDYITKPFSVSLLKAKIKNTLNNRQKLKELFKNNLDFAPEEIATTSIDEEFLTKIKTIVEKNLTNTDFTVDDFANEIGLSKTRLFIKLKSLTGLSANTFIRTYRLKKAASMLKQKKYLISEIAYSVGFNDPKYFSRCFKMEFGVTPGEYSSILTD